jgi:hypothetical protein
MEKARIYIVVVALHPIMDIDDASVEADSSIQKQLPCPLTSSQLKYESFVCSFVQTSWNYGARIICTRCQGISKDDHSEQLLERWQTIL